MLFIMRNYEMTIKMPNKNLGDFILKFLGKKRAVYIPQNLYKTYGPYVYSRAIRESFWRALFRSKNSTLQDGWTYL